MDWPRSTEELLRQQESLGAAGPPLWHPPVGGYSVGGCFVCFPRGGSGSGAEGDAAWVGACLLPRGGGPRTVTSEGLAGAPYEAGLLVSREGRLLEEAVRGLGTLPEVLLVNATGRDHPRRAGLAVHLGARLDLPTVGVTHRPLLAAGEWPELRRGASSPLCIGDEPVGSWLCTRAGARPLAVHAAWRTDPAVAAAVVLAAGGGRYRTPEPLRQARRAARRARQRGTTPTPS